MRTFIIRARKGSTRFEQVRSNIGDKNHIEIIAHFVINAFFISNGFRTDVEVYIVLESSADFPRTIRLLGNEKLSIAGFHEEAVIELLEKTLRNSQGLQKDETKHIAEGVYISGYGFEKCIKHLEGERPIYLLDNKGTDIRETALEMDAVFILSDHLAMPKNNVKGLKRQGIKTISLGRKMLFASQCVVLINHELDRLI